MVNFFFYSFAYPKFAPYIAFVIRENTINATLQS